MNLDPEKYYFSDTSFDLLMQKRIRKVLIISSNYDAFILEEDGRIEEQIFNEYVSLNLSNPPTFLHACSEEEALDILKNNEINLFIIMYGHGEYDVFAMAKKLKNFIRKVPIVLLTHFTREVSLQLQAENLDSFDYVFSWLGNADLLLAIIKLIEDKINAPYDIGEIGVQSILFIEDSIRYISTFLPALYKIILEQSRDYTSEALNEHQKMLRKRGRPKILLATNLREAKAYYSKYKNNLLGIISDVNFKVDNRRKSPKIFAGIELGKEIKSVDQNIPIIFQSSEINNKIKATELGSNFIHKISPNLYNDLKSYLLNDFGFGDFVFRDPKNLNEVARANNLKSLQEKITDIPVNILLYHAQRDHFSRWLKARALFPVSRLLKDIKPEDFDNINQTRNFILNVISKFRASKARGIIADINVDQFDEYSVFARSGEGSVGGKARGIAFLDLILKKNEWLRKYNDISFSIPRTLALSTSIFDEFISQNNLFEFAINCNNDDEILQKFVNSTIPERYIENIRKFVDTFQNPIAIRSSSKLEDSYFQSFAGVYSTYMVNTSDKSTGLQNVLKAIKSVYASVYYKASKSYINSTSNIIDEEKMGVVLQEVCGSWKGDFFYPSISGVARSLNFYPLEHENHEDGSASIAVGLGKYIADGGLTLHFCPKFAQNALQISTSGQMLKNTQKKILAINVNIKDFIPDVHNDTCVSEIMIKDIENIPGINHLVSTYDLNNDVVRDTIFIDGKRLITFNPILKHHSFPLAEIIKNLLETGRKEMNNHIEIEFALDFKPDNEKTIFNIVQIRPINISNNTRQCPVRQMQKSNALLYSGSTMGNGYYEEIKHVVYVKRDGFHPSKNVDLAEQISDINEKMKKDNINYLLIGPGRWGSADNWLGIPVKWAQVTGARVIVEYHIADYNVEPSQGSHFFHNLVQFGVGYFSVKHKNINDYIDFKYLDTTKAYSENDNIKIIKLKRDLKICIDGKEGKGIVIKPDKKEK